jgi:hypothetical protein
LDISGYFWIFLDISGVWLSRSKWLSQSKGLAILSGRNDAHCWLC